MSQLLDELNLILQEKQDKIKPENIKKGIQIFDIEGTYEGNSSDVKLFETEEQMQQDPNANEGDLAVVYREEIQNMTADSQTQFITFPETVTLPSAITESYYCMLRSIDSSSSYFDGNIQLSKTSFRFDGYSESGMIRVQYSSSDGITYTRTRFSGDSGDLTNPVDLGTEIHCEMQEQWNDNFGYFMQIGGNVFEGLYEYQNYVIENTFNCVNYTSNSEPSVNYKIPDKIIEMEKNNRAPLIIVENSELDSSGKFYNILQCKTYDASARMNDLRIGITADEKYYIMINIYKSASDEIELTETNWDFTQDYPIIETQDLSRSYMNTLPVFGNRSNGSSTGQDAYRILKELEPNQTNIVIAKEDGPIIITTSYTSSELGDGVTIISVENRNIYKCQKVTDNAYLPASTQLTARPENVFNSTAYSNSGVFNGTLGNTSGLTKDELISSITLYNKLNEGLELPVDCSHLFENTSIKTYPNLISTNTKDTSYMFYRSNVVEAPQLDTSAVINMEYMFYQCYDLIELPNYDFSNVTNMNRFAEQSSNLIKLPTGMSFPKVESAEHAFSYLSGIEEVPEMSFDSLINGNAMFYCTRNISIFPYWNLPNVEDLSSFVQETHLITVNDIIAPKVKTIKRMFYNCDELVNVPVFNFPNVTNMSEMFNRCPNLSDDSLNNILQICINATSMASNNKKLFYIGLSEEQATKCTTLSNYSAFTAAGWTTGY